MSSSELPSEQTAPGARVEDPARVPGIPVVQLGENTWVQLGDVGSIPIGTRFSAGR